MTNREFFNAIISASVSDELTAHAAAELEKLDARNAKRSLRRSWRMNPSRLICWRFWQLSL